MTLRIFWYLMCAAVATAYHRETGIPCAKALWRLEATYPDYRITHGLHAIRSQNPFFAGLIISLASKATSMCGSSLISSTKLVTAAHCWNDGKEHGVKLMVVLGSVRLFSGGTRIVTNQVETNRAYDSSTVHNDIAMITIPAVAFSEYIKPITLPEGDLLKTTYEGRAARVVGFGKTNEYADIVATQSLRYAIVAIVSNDRCNLYGPYFHHESMICSGPLYGSPCGGDSGGPLYVYDDKRSQQYLIGLVSYGSKAGCDLGHPAVYTRISYFIDWIKARI